MHFSVNISKTIKLKKKWRNEEEVYDCLKFTVVREDDVLELLYTYVYQKQRIAKKSKLQDIKPTLIWKISETVYIRIE